MTWIDFTNCEPHFKGYDGADGKKSVIYNGEVYMLKFPSKRPSKNHDAKRVSYSNNIYSEYIGCHIFASIGMPTQETSLGSFGGKPVVACKDFVEGISADVQLQEFSKLENSLIDTDDVSSSGVPALENINIIFERHERLSSISDDARKRFWDTFVVDALLGNFDRHSGNWGYLVNKKTGDASLAPIYDCGSCLYSQLADDAIEALLKDKGGLNNRVYNYPLAALKINDKKVNYHDFVTGLTNKDCNEALQRIFPRINMPKIKHIVNSTPGASEIRWNVL